MIKKKQVFLAAAFFLFVLFVWYFGFLKQLLHASSQRLLQFWVQAAENQIQVNLMRQTRCLEAWISEYADEADYEKALSSMAKDLRENGTDRGIYLSDRQGIVYDIEKRASYRIEDLNLLALAEKEGVSVVRFSGAGKEAVGMILPVKRASRTPYFWVHTMPPSDFEAYILNDVLRFADFVKIFDQAGKELGAENEMHALFNQKQNRVRDLLWKRKDDFVSSGRHISINSAGILKGCDVLVRLNSPKGWIIGGSISLPNLVPFHFKLLYASLIGFIVLLFLIFLWLGLKKTKKSFNITDSLTGLPSGFHLENRLKEHLKNVHGDGSGNGCYLVSLDIGGFRRFNSLFGHSLGDRFLSALGLVLKEHYISPIRIGGDRFVFLAFISRSDAGMLDKTISTVLEERVGKHYLQVVNFKIGIYPVGEGEENIREMLVSAHLALSFAKKSHKNNVVIYDKPLKERMDLVRKLETNMLYALSKAEFLVYIQPKYKIADGTSFSGEALVRWKSEDLGLIVPDLFIPLFEQNGFIVEIDFFVLSTVFKSIQRRLAKGERVSPISVNQSRVTITYPRYLERLSLLIERHPIPLKYIELEVTESVLEEDHDSLLQLIDSIKSLGLTISLDDFGSGYSSLNTLRMLPIDTLKIDKEFIMDSGKPAVSARSKKIISHIVSMSHALGIEVVCEGVETKEQFDFLSGIGCHYIQGYYCAKPMTLEEYEAASK